MYKSLGEIAKLVNGTVEGDQDTIITGVAGIKEAGPGDITFVAKPKYLPLLATTAASAVIVGFDAPASEKNLVRTEHPYLAFTEVLKMFAVELPVSRKIHPSATVGEDVRLGTDVALYPGVVLEDGCTIGERSVLYSGVCVGRDSEIGPDCTIYPRVVIADDVRIGSRVIIHIGAVIGSGKHCGLTQGMDGPKPAFNAVVEDDCEIGANVTVSGSSSRTTTIGAGTKIDNLVHVGPGAQIGSNSLLVSHVSVGSDCVIGNGVTLAGQASVLDGVKVGDGTIVAARAGLTEDVGANRLVSGFPATSHEKWLRIYASMSRLPSLAKEIRDLKQQLQSTDRAKNAETKND